ncbi:MAG TPA: phosphoglycerate dehydrogenase [Geobacteraceae bacterium]|nr:phosphoglycerate dehydrogenase [Geobacteraceae bacterium]
MKVIVTEQLAHEGLLLLEKDPRIEVDVRLGLSKEELISVIGDYEAIVTRSATKVDRDVLEAGKKLKLVARAGVGIDSVDVKTASAQGIIVLNAPFGNTNSVAEHTLALALSLCRNIPKADASLKRGEWKRSALIGSELKGKVVGVIGLSKVGGRVVTRLQAFECEVIGSDPYVSEKRARDLGIRLVSTEEIIRTADIITLHIPLTDETRNMIGEMEIGQMKDGVILINTARGGVINEEALLNALKSGKVGGAAIDVWTEEPPKSELLKELIAHEKVVSMPHLGASTREAQVNVAVDVAREIIRYLDEQPLENAVNIPRFDLTLMEQMRPFLHLVNIMGDFVVQLLDTNMNKVTFTYEGNISEYCTTPITVCGLAALLNRKVEQDVNMVNANLVAETMGIAVEEVKLPESGSFSNMITITIEGPNEKRVISGTHFEGTPRIVKLRDYQVDFAPEEYMLLLSYQDRPGMIGKIGMILGRHEINIGAMHLGRRKKKGEAMVILSLDSPAPSNVVEEIRTATEATFSKALHIVTARESK